MSRKASTKATEREHPATPVVRLRAMRKALWMRELWAGEGDAGPVGAIGHGEVDRILSDPAAMAKREKAFYKKDEAAQKLTGEIEAAEGALAEEERWTHLAEACGLGTGARQMLALAVAAAQDPTLGRAYAYLHDQPDMTHATTWLAAALFGEEGEPVEVAGESALLRWRLLRKPADAPASGGAWGAWAADEKITAWLIHDREADLPAGAELRPAESYARIPVLYAGALKAAVEFLDLLEREGGPRALEIELLGLEASGKKTLAGQIARAREKPLLAVDEAALLRGGAEADAEGRVLEAVRSARLRGALLYWGESREPSAAARAALRGSPGTRIVGRTTPPPDAAPAGMALRSVTVPALRRSEREALWTAVGKGPAPWQVSEWLMTPGEIVQVAQVAEAGEEAIQQACRRPTESQQLLARLPLPYGENDLVLPQPIEDQLRDFERQIRLRWDVYERWGFERLVPNGRGIVALFAGPTGTGKTMATQVLARRLGMELYRLDPAQVVNKYIGETEKRLKVIFDECDRANFLMLIDECEGMFGQRFASKDAHDRYANLEIDYLLQRLERFQGVAVLATNRKGDLDNAFMRRLRFVIDFLPPSPAERRRLWEKSLPEKGPEENLLREELNWDALAENVPLTGAEIKLAALNAAFLARAEEKKIGMEHVLTAVRRELAKKGQTLRGFDK